MIRRSRTRRATSLAKCREVGRALQNFLDGDVEESFAARIQEHLDACRDCGLEADTYSKIKEALESQRGSVGPEVIDRLRAFGKKLAEESN